MLLVTTTMRMLDGVHGDSSNSGPGSSSLCLHLVEDGSGLADWLVDSATSGNDSDHSSAGAKDGSSGSGRKSDSSLLQVFGVTDDDGRGAGSSGERASVSDLGLAVGHNSSFGELVDWKNVSNAESGYSIIIN